MWVKFLAPFEKQALLTKTIAGSIILRCTILKSYFRDLIQMWGKFFVLFEKQAVVSKGISVC